MRTVKFFTKKRLIISFICISVLVFGSLGFAVASGTYSHVSKGIMQINDQVIFDSSDLDTIYNEVSDGKQAIASRMTSTAGVSDASLKDGGIYTFEKLVAGVDTTYTNGKSATWQEIRDAADAGTISSDFSGVTSVDTLKDAIDNNNVTYATSHLSETMASNPTTVADAGYKHLNDVTIKGQVVVCSNFGSGANQGVIIPTMGFKYARIEMFDNYGGGLEFYLDDRLAGTITSYTDVRLNVDIENVQAIRFRSVVNSEALGQREGFILTLHDAVYIN